MLKVLVAFLCLALLLTMSAVVSPVQAAGKTWTVLVGGATPDLSVSANKFFPETLEVSTGDTVKFQFELFHTVTFLSGAKVPPIFTPENGKNYFNPQIFFPAGPKTYGGTGYRNSGTPTEDPRKFSYSLTFTKAGSYEYACIIHPGMTGKINVKSRAVGSPQAVLAAARRQQAAVIKAGAQAFANLPVRQEGKTTIVPMLGNTKAGWSILAYTPKPLRVAVGSKVTWTMQDPAEIHTVSFTNRKLKPGAEVLVEPQKNAPPKLRFQDFVEKPSGGATFDGMGEANSGILFTPGFGPPNAPGKYTLAFPKAGTYEYACLVHVPFMRGTVVVK